MKYTRNINALLLLCAMHMHAMEKEIRILRMERKHS